MTNKLLRRIARNRRVDRFLIRAHNASFMPRYHFRRLTSRNRVLPDCLILGAQKSGSTSLFKYLIRYPWIVGSLRKEVHFFDINFNKGLNWYRIHFPSIKYKNYIKKRRGSFVTIEASPYYLFHPHTPKKVLKILPDVKLVILLRNPVHRAYSHYNHEVRLGFETVSFKRALEKEEERLTGELEKMQENENYYSFNHQHFSYLSRGIYVEQIKEWMKYFLKDQILILKSEDFYENPRKIIKEVTEFLNVPEWDLGNYKQYNYGKYSSKMDEDLRRYLIEYYKLYNKQLYEFLGKNLQWDN